MQTVAAKRTERAQAPCPPPELGFNPKNRFESFVVGHSNELACAAALGVAQSPGGAYNPLFIYGGVGLGKTHLLHAIAEHLWTHNKRVRLCCVSAEEFCNDYNESLQTTQLARFRKQYREADVLLMDDVQFLSGRDSAQEELFHTFNALHKKQRQIALTCDRTAGQIQKLDPRLVSRFEWGLVAELMPPDIELRMAVVRKKAQALGVRLADPIVEFLANRIRANTRKLEGAVIRVASYEFLQKQEITVSAVERLLGEILLEEGRYMTGIGTIQRKVAEHFDIGLEEMTSRRRPENISFPRQIAMFISRKLTETTLAGIGQTFGGRDHATVLRACKLVQDRMEVDPSVRQVVSYLEKQLAG
ncbi:MAG TPA: chromosomal replication initiator protein DnaA [Candidatus Acidoferrum sp.]|nr:chromosomal replication initiator protein DnaA [Candidatus Acidoferrum sp.]